MGSTSAELTRSFSSFSGCDIKVVIGPYEVGQLQAISYAVQRARAPIHVLGSKDPKTYARGKRAIAGTIVALMLDQHLIKSQVFSNNKLIVSKTEQIAQPDDLNDASDTADLTTVDPSYTFNAGDLSGSYELVSAWYMDQLPPFDVVIVAANEVGNAATMRIYGLEIVNEGSGFSVDDMMIENQMTYVARSISPWTKLGSWDLSTGAWSAAV